MIASRTGSKEDELGKGMVYGHADALSAFRGQQVFNEFFTFIFTSFVLLNSWGFESSECFRMAEAGQMKQTS
jgi:hypothetical protein